VLYKTIRYRGVKLLNDIGKTMECDYTFVTFTCQLNSCLSLNNINPLDN